MSAGWTGPTGDVHRLLIVDSGPNSGRSADAKPDGLVVAELGPLMVFRGDQQLAVRGDRARLAMALLVLNHQVGLSLDAMVELMWPRSDQPATARQSLSNIVGRLRTVLGPGSIVTDDGRYQLTDAVHSDRQHFLDAITEVEALTAAGAWERAVEKADGVAGRWRGTPWDGIDEVSVVAEDRRFLEMRRVRLMTLRTASLLAIQRWGDAIDGYRWLIEADPWNETSHLGLAKALTADGQRTEAMRAVAEARAVLAEAGMTPGQELAEVERELLAVEVDHRPDPTGGSPSDAPPRLDEAELGSVTVDPSLPRARDRFVGRTGELQLLARMLDEGRLITLVGPGGVGKTRLAVEAAAVTPFEQIRFVDLTPTSDPARVPAMVAEAVGVSAGSAPAIADELARRTAGERLLLIVDNCEHLIDAAGDLTGEVLDRCPTVTVLATSREALELPGERVLPVTPLLIGHGSEPGPAMDLLVARASAADPDLDLLDDPTTAERICRLVDGLPLAIELAAGRLRALTPSELADRLGGRLSLLEAKRGRAARHRTLEAVVEWSYDLLEPDEQVAFERLSVFVGGFTSDAAEAVIADDLIPGDRVFDLVVRLVERSLLVAGRGDHGRQRFHQLETLRAFAGERHRRRPDHQRVSDRHLAWALGHVDRLEQAMRTPEQDAALATVVADHDNFRAARQLADDQGRPLDALRITASVPLDDLAGRRRILLDLLARVGGVPPAHLAHATYALASAEFELGDYGDAIGHAAAAADRYHHMGERRHQAYAQMIEAMCRWGHDDEQDAIEPLLEAAMTSFTLLGDEMGQGYIAFVWAGWIVSRQGDLTKASVLAQRSRELFGRVDSPFGLAHGEEAAAQVASAAGEAELALSTACSAAARLYEQGNSSCLAHVLDTVSMVKARVGDLDGAAWLLGAADRLRQESGTAVKPWEVSAAVITDTILGADGEPSTVAATRRQGWDAPMAEILSHLDLDATRA